MAKLTQTTKTAAVKTAATKAVKAQTVKAQTVKTFYAPSNQPTAGRYLFAYTMSVIGIVESLPKAKQSAAAQWFHGSSALRHHGAEGTRKIIRNSDGSVTYDKGYFACGPNSLDEKRRAVPSSYVTAFSTFLKTGEFPKAISDGFAFKSAGKKTLNVSL
jgi:hypothetical protein